MSQNDDEPTQDPDLQLIAAHEVFVNAVKKSMRTFKDPQVKNYIPFLEIIDPTARDKAFRDYKPKRGLLTEIAIYMTKHFKIKKKSTSTTLKSMTTQELISYVLKSTIAASPSSCNNCNMTFNNGSKTEFKCFICGTDLCPSCNTEDAVAKIKSISSHAVIICVDCDEEIDIFADHNGDNSSQEAAQLAIPFIPSQNNDDNDDNVMEQEAMIEIEDEEEDIPLIIDPEVALKEQAKDDTLFPDDKIFEEINSTIITISSQNEFSITSLVVSPEKSKSSSSTPKPTRLPKAGVKPSAVAKEIEKSDSTAPNTKVIIPVEKSPEVNKNEKTQEHITWENVKTVENCYKPKLTINNTSRVNIISTISTENLIEQPSQKPSTSNEAPKNENVTKEIPFIEVSNVKNKKITKQNKNTENESQDKICMFYIQFKCKFGRWGEECPYEHPKICYSFMSEGKKGCNKDDNCQYFHPEICTKSLEGLICTAKKCKLGHFKHLIEDVPKVGKKDTTSESRNSKPNFRTLASKDSKMKKSTPLDQDQSPPPPPIKTPYLCQPQPLSLLLSPLLLQ